MKYLANPKIQSGVTLIELLIVIAIAAILASLAGPSFTDFINRTRLNSQVSQLVSDLNRARSEAIKRNTPALLCVRANDTTCGNTTDWQNGWLVCVGSTTCTTLISIHAPLSATITLTGPVNGVQFRPNGSSGLGAATLTAGGTGLNSKVVQVSVTGNISRP